MSTSTACLHTLITLKQLELKNCIRVLPNSFRGLGLGARPWSPRKPGNSPQPGPEVVERPKKLSKPSDAESIVQNEMKDVLGRVSAEAASRILDSANFSEVRV